MSLIASSAREKVKSFFRKVFASPFFWIFILAIFLLRTILFTAGTPSHGDLTYPASLDLYLKALFPLWNDHTGVTNLESVDRAFSIVMVALAQFTGGVDSLSKLFFLVPLLISGFTAAFLAKFVLLGVYPNRSPNNLVVIIAAFVYMINPWMLEQVQAPLFWLSYAITPGIILLSYRLFTERRLLFGVGTAILWTIASTTPQYTIFSFAIILFVWLISFLFTKFKKEESALSVFKQDLKFLGVIICVYIVFNIYWVIPIALSLSSGPIIPGYVFNSGMLQIFSQNSSWKILGGVDQWTTWWPLSSSLNGLAEVAVIAWLTTLFVSILLLLRRRKTDSKLFWILLGLWVIGIFFALGWNNIVYQWLATQAPLSSYYGWLLRVPGKISYLLWPAYAVSIAIVGQSVYNYLASKKHKFSKKFIILLGTIVLLVASNSYAIIKQQDYFNFYYTPISVPETYQQAFSYIGQHLNNSNVVADVAPYVNGIDKNSIGFGDNFLGLGVSDNPYEASYTWNPYRIAGYFVPRSISVPSIGDYHFTYASTWTQAYQNFNQNSSNNQTTLSSMGVSWFPVYGVDYVLYHNDIVGTNSTAQIDLQTLNQTGFELVKQWNYIYLYKVPQDFGRIYALPYNFQVQQNNQPPTIDDITSSEVEISNLTELNPTLWTLSANATSPFTLIFTEGFDTNWVATVQSGSQTEHYSSLNGFGSINSFAITQTGLLKISLTYKPQVWLNYGYDFSGIGILSLIMVALYMNRKKIRNALII
jgi:hypothetical protein